MRNSKISIKNVCAIAIMTAITAVLAQIIIPLPSGIPISMQTFAVMLSGIVLGAKCGAVSSLVYLLLGMFGVPVFTGLRGGLQVIIGPTGGFLLAFPILAFLSGVAIRYQKKNKCYMIILIIAGILVNYGVGVIFFCLLMKSSIRVALITCVAPFLIGDIIKTIMAILVGKKLRYRLEIALQ